MSDEDDRKLICQIVAGGGRKYTAGNIDRRKYDRLVDLGWLTSSVTNISDVEYDVTEKGQAASVEDGKSRSSAAEGEGMSEPKTGLASLGLDNAIRLRWALRDIRGKRLNLTPVDPNDLRILIDMGYLEMKDDVPIVTGAGLEEIES
jgi:hypothetical protein